MTDSVVAITQRNAATQLNETNRPIPGRGSLAGRSRYTRRAVSLAAAFALVADRTGALIHECVLHGTQGANFAVAALTFGIALALFNVVCAVLLLTAKSSDRPLAAQPADEPAWSQNRPTHVWPLDRATQTH